MRIVKLFILLLLFISSGCGSVAGDSLRIALITDVHYLSPSLYDEGDARLAYEQSVGRHFDDQHKVQQHIWNQLLKDKPDLLLISGDLTHHGEKQSHLDFIDQLHTLKEKGIRILVIPGNHDINIPDAAAYRGGERQPVSGITKEEFATLYEPFGYGDALYRDEASLSYVAALDATHWLLCIDSNRYDENTTGSISSGRIKPQTLEWALTLLKEANLKGITVLGMMHHGLVEHMPYQSAFFPGYLVEDWEAHATTLADAGMPLLFTGHFHANDITRFTTSSGKSIHDVETASLAQYPYAWRMMTLQPGSIKIKSHFVQSLPHNTNLAKDARSRLEEVTRRVAEQRLKSLGYPIPEELMPLLTNLIVKLNLKHVEGDEKADPEMMLALKMFASFLGNEVKVEEFLFDFPPEDNNTTITWGAEAQQSEAQVAQRMKGAANTQGAEAQQSEDKGIQRMKGATNAQDAEAQQTAEKGKPN